MTLPDWLRGGGSPTLVVAGRELPVVVRRMQHARRLTLRLAADGKTVRVAAPSHARTADALAFARRHVEWLGEQLARVAEPCAPSPGQLLPYRGANLLLMHSPEAPRRPRLVPEGLEFGGPAESVPRRLRTWLEAEARRLLAADLAEYCARAGRPVPPLALSNARRRWGSCSAGGAVRINWRLVMAPDAVRRSVVAHEVAHLVHFDHGPKFKALLREIYESDLAEADHWLRREGRSLYVSFG